MHKINIDSYLISVIVPAYNAEKYIDETVQSVLNQTYQTWELILVNDGSTDHTSALVNMYSANPQIKVVHQKNEGVSNARNAGTLHAHGSYYCFLDADDLLTEDCLQKRVDYLKEKESDFLHNDIEIMLSNSTRTRTIMSGLSGDVLNALLRWENTVVPGPSSFIISKRCFENVGGFDESLSTAADQDYFIRVAEKYRIDKIAEVLTLYRVHEQNMHKNIFLMELDHIRVFKKADQRKLFHSFWFRQYCFSNLYLILAGSWWGDGKNRSRGFLFAIRSIIVFPPIVLKIMKRLLKNRSKRLNTAGSMETTKN